MLQDTASHKKLRTLPDNPSDKDAFGAHEKLANAIANLINDEDVGKSIALTGSWGSGKSTVVKHITDILKGHSQGMIRTEVFIFDAWMHQNDPLRRAFLEELIGFLSAPRLKWIDTVKWERKKNLLAKRLKITVETAKPRFTRGGAWMFIAALFVPMGLALMKDNESKADRNAHLISSSPWTMFCYIAPFIFATLPFWVWISLLLARIRGKDAFKQNSSSETTPWYDLLHLLVSQTSSTTHHESQDTPDPTSIEFQKEFREIISDAIGAQNDKKLVIVIDNLDRVDAADALIVWSTMRAFLDVSNLPENSPLKYLWLIVPFDPFAIDRLWGQQFNGNLKPDVSQPLSASFIDKTFQIVFKVPPPVLSDWTKFLHSQLEIAFRLHTNPEDFEKTVQIYRLYLRTKSKSVTPRELKLFVNQLVALYRQWNDEIPFAVLATYAIYQHSIQDPERDIAQNLIISTAIVDSLEEPKLQSFLAALHFNIPVTKALQVLLEVIS